MPLAYDRMDTAKARDTGQPARRSHNYPIQRGLGRGKKGTQRKQRMLV